MGSCASGVTEVSLFALFPALRARLLGQVGLAPSKLAKCCYYILFSLLPRWGLPPRSYQSVSAYRVHLALAGEAVALQVAKVRRNRVPPFAHVGACGPGVASVQLFILFPLFAEVGLAPSKLPKCCHLCVAPLPRWGLRPRSHQSVVIYRVPPLPRWGLWPRNLLLYIAIPPRRGWACTLEVPKRSYLSCYLCRGGAWRPRRCQSVAI